MLAGGQLMATGSVDDVLTAENVRDVYQVEALFGLHQSERYVLPWRRR